MALMACPECGKEVSSAATSCPYCGYPVSQYVEEQERIRMENEVTIAKEEYEKWLLDKITKEQFTVPEPRAKVCAKCTAMFGHGPETKGDGFGQPGCSCCAPFVEIDYPEAQGLNIAGADLYRFNYCVDHNIGDQESDSYKKFKKYLDMVISNSEFFLHQKVNPEPPDEKFFGVHRKPGKQQTYVPIPTPTVPKCPICGSTSLTKISTAKKVAKVSVFGIFGMGDTGKTWQCNSCGSKF